MTYAFILNDLIDDIGHYLDGVKETSLEDILTIVIENEVLIAVGAFSTHSAVFRENALSPEYATSYVYRELFSIKEFILEIFDVEYNVAKKLSTVIYSFFVNIVRKNILLKDAYVYKVVVKKKVLYITEVKSIYEIRYRETLEYKDCNKGLWNEDSKYWVI